MSACVAHTHGTTVVRSRQFAIKLGIKHVGRCFYNTFRFHKGLQRLFVTFDCRSHIPCWLCLHTPVLSHDYPPELVTVLLYTKLHFKKTFAVANHINCATKFLLN